MHRNGLIFDIISKKKIQILAELIKRYFNTFFQFSSGVFGDKRGVHKLPKGKDNNFYLITFDMYKKPRKASPNNESHVFSQNYIYN